MKHSVRLMLISAVFLSFGAQAQQDAAFSMYMFNGLFLNPAYAGSTEVPTATAIYRHQWSGIEGAPRDFNISGHAPLRNGQYALGAALHYDQLGFERKYKADLDFAFRVHVRGPEHRLSFGLRAGLLHHEVQPGNYRPDDALPPDMVLDQVYRSTVPNASFGIHAYGRRYFAGISFPYLLSARGNGPEDVVFNHSEQQQFRRVLVSAGGVFGREYSRVKVKPSVLYSYASHAPFDLDINLNLLLIDRIWIGGSYRIGGDRSDGKGASLVAVCKFKATQQLEIGYAYDHTLSGLGSLSGGSHEIMMSFELHRERSHLVTPRYIRYF